MLVFSDRYSGAFEDLDVMGPDAGIGSLTWTVSLTVNVVSAVGSIMSASVTVSVSLISAGESEL